MNFLPLSRRVLQCALILLATTLTTACVSLFPGEATPTQVWYELKDLHPQEPGNVRPQRDSSKAHTLLIGPVESTAFCDGNMLAFSADGKSRAYYQFASWTDRPAKRLGVLAEKRLAGGTTFASVAQSTAGIRGDLMLNLTLEECVHDASSLPGEAQLTFTAELIDWRSRTLIARRTFAGHAAVSQANAIAAVNGMSQALTEQLDALSAWIETSLPAAAGH